MNTLSPKHATAFWVNTYNLLALHTYLTMLKEDKDPFGGMFESFSRRYLIVALQSE